MSNPPRPDEPRHALARAHERFARRALVIYLGAAALALLMFIVALTTDLAHEEQEARDMLLLVTQVRAQYLAHHLGLLARELTRLGLRSEVDLLDQNLQPEQDLLRLTHRKSAFFDVGVAIITADGKVAWSEPQHFLPVGTSFAREEWFTTVEKTQLLRIVPIQPESDLDSIVYVVSPIVRGGQSGGAIIGAIDLASGGAIEPLSHPRVRTTALLVNPEGAVVYPARPPEFARDPHWKALLTHRSPQEPLMLETSLSGKPSFLAGAPVGDSDLTFLSMVSRETLFQTARARLFTRLALGLLLAVVPLLVLVSLLRRSLKLFKQAEEAAVREERLHLLGEASNLIAHEIKNSLSGFNVGLDLVALGAQPGHEARQARAVKALRTEIQRLSDFTTELLLFSKGVVPRPVKIDLGEFAAKVAELQQDAADELGLGLNVLIPETTVPVQADPSLVHVVISNLTGNALDALAASDVPTPAMHLEVRVEGRKALLRVSDNGPGVSESIRERLFEPFVTGKPSGTGIGLSLSRKIARAHGGDLELEHTPSGASFLLTLPLAGSPTQKVPAEEE